MTSICFLNKHLKLSIDHKRDLMTVLPLDIDISPLLIIAHLQTVVKVLDHMMGKLL